MGIIKARTCFSTSMNSTAIHIAGHCVGAIAVGIPVKSATIRRRNKQVQGHVHFGIQLRPKRLLQSLSYAGSICERYNRQLFAPYIARAMVLMAGTDAEVSFASRDFNRFRDNPEINEANRICNYIDLMLSHFLSVRTSWLLYQPFWRECLRAISRQLISKKTIMSQDLSGTIRCVAAKLNFKSPWANVELLKSKRDPAIRDAFAVENVGSEWWISAMPVTMAVRIPVFHFTKPAEAHYYSQLLNAAQLSLVSSGIQPYLALERAGHK